MSRTNWKRIRPTSLLHAMRLCKDFAAERHNLSVERIADRMGVTVDSLYKWLSTGRMPANLVPPYELACGIDFVSSWLAVTAGKLVIEMPTGRKVSTSDVVGINAGWASAMQLLTTFYTDPARTDAEATLAALREHLEQVAYHHHNVAQYEAPQLEFGP
ncbi:hypothetical protein [Variovorax sp.]|uniref:hypothetical protein n=1 Tax=Variovorax sp. TaxID=1871043 RepID=UPI003BAD55F9